MVVPPKCRITGCGLHEYSNQLCPLHLLRVHNEINVDLLESWVLRTPRQETLERKKAQTLLGQLIPLSPNLQELFSDDKVHSNRDRFEWWNLILCGSHDLLQIDKLALLPDSKSGRAR
jgi:hypothetical protein